MMMNKLNEDMPPMEKRGYNGWRKILRTILRASRSSQEKIYSKLGKHLAKRRVAPRKLVRMLKNLAIEQGYDAREVKLKIR